MRKELDNAISETVAPLISKYQLMSVNSETDSMGAVEDYTGGNLFVRAINERGILGLEIGSIYNKNSLRSVSSIKTWRQPPANGIWNLSLKQMCEFVDQNWEWLNEKLNRESCKETIQILDDYLREKY